MRHAWIFAIFGAVAATAGARADRLLTTNGDEVPGQVSPIGGGYVVVTPDGDRLTFADDEVRRVEYTSTVTPAVARDMLADLRALIDPLLAAPEPEQFVYYDEITTFDNDSSVSASTARYDAASRVSSNWSRGGISFGGSFGGDGYQRDAQRSGSLVRTVRRVQLSDDVFADEWLRYVAPFNAVARDSRYRDLTNGRRNSGSLADFSRRAPDAYEPAARAVREALRAVDKCLDLAADTRKRLSALPLRPLSHDEDIRELEIDLAREQDRLRTARDYWEQKERVYRAEDRLRERIAKRDNELARARGVAERKINEFAHAREVARQLLTAAEAQLEQSVP